ncbi:Ion channel [Roseovarius litorisediminis]|uniref:Ion channel n=1 Tax=Roseovarius litorisediminis TaxID=1312363 RepID=A0A1Y5RA50_9RHOB|nr:potassium channel family protein [Roseovarius litorisediminis]SLN12654.1 Ion channel [Roseovarius litorisediminis]
MRSLQALALLSTLALIILGGTVFFHLVEGWNWIDSYFFTVVTLSTVGYGSLVPATTLGKIGTTIFIFVGLGVFAVAIQQFGSFTVKRREKHTEWLVARLGHHNVPDSEEPKPANEPESPPE